MTIIMHFYTPQLILDMLMVVSRTTYSVMIFPTKRCCHYIFCDLFSKPTCCFFILVVGHMLEVFVALYVHLNWYIAFVFNCFVYYVLVLQCAKKKNT